MADPNESRELLAVLDRVERMFHNLDQGVGRLRETVERSVGGLEQSITHLVRSIEQEDRLRERADRAEGRERDELRELITEDLVKRIENLAKGLRGLPAAVLDHTEKKVYELRAARWELVQAGGVRGEPTPTVPLLPHRESTGKIAVARRDVEETTGVFDLKHTDGEQRAAKELIGGVALFLWHRGGKWVATFGSGAGLLHLLQRLLGH